MVAWVLLVSLVPSLVTLMMLTVVVMPIGILAVNVRGRRCIIVMCSSARVGLRMHRRGGYRGVHVHLPRMDGRRRWWIRVRRFHGMSRWLNFLFFVVFVLRCRHWVHPVVLVSLALVEHSIVATQRLPSISDYTSNTSALRRYTTIALLHTENMLGKEDIVASLEAFAAGFFIGRLVFRHFFFVALTVGFGPVCVERERQKVMK